MLKYHTIQSNFQKYLAYIKKMHSWLNQLAKDENLNIIWVYCDYFGAVLRHRCLIRQYVIGEFWRLSNPERKKRLTYNRMVKLFDVLNKKDYIHYLNEKNEFNAYFNDFVHRDWIFSGDASADDFKSFVEKHDAVIIKPMDGVEGFGIRKFVLSKNPDVDIKDMFENLVREGVMIEEIITPNPRMVFGNTSVNTIRTHTILDKNGKAHVIKTILRVGVGDSVIDNYCQGGVIYEVDINTGLVCSHGQSKGNSQCYIHPGTDIVMLGYQIPNWDKVIEASEKAAEQLPQIRIIGWDVAITDNDVELIEGNHNPDYELLEFMGSTGYYEKIMQLI